MVTGTQTILNLQNVTLGYGNKKILNNISLTLHSGEIVCLLGPNGVGKTTLFKTLMGSIPPLSGSITINGTPMSSFSSRDCAKVIAYVPQVHHTPFPYTVREVVLFGRAAHLGMFSSPRRKDRMIADQSLELLDIKYLADRNYVELSGGERQMVIIARALAQKTPFIILDEPTSNLDYGNQIRVIKKIQELKQQAVGIFMSTHSPDHVFMLEAKTVMLNKGGLYDQGRSESVVTRSSLRSIYGVDVHIFDTPVNGSPSRKICAPDINTKTVTKTNSK